jgi:Rps23 Pro-64 3,4-dihydroxylase Tpa1-like proline 4-hydroxylase
MNYINKNVLNFTFEAEPFTHIIIDGFINDAYIDVLLSDIDELTIDKSYYFGSPDIEKNKYAFKHGFNINLQELFTELNSDEFINILEEKTGITGIIRNNVYLHGAGVHKILNNGFLSMHTDFEGYTDDKYGLLDRRMNLLLYMNPEWKDSYGGELCLYDNVKGEITKQIKPILNRCVIFFTPGNIHGHPNSLNIPSNITRQSIATYYYTKNTTGKNLDGLDISSVKWYNNIK